MAYDTKGSTVTRRRENSVQGEALEKDPQMSNRKKNEPFKTKKTCHNHMITTVKSVTHEIVKPTGRTNILWQVTEMHIWSPSSAVSRVPVRRRPPAVTPGQRTGAMEDEAAPAGKTSGARCANETHQRTKDGKVQGLIDRGTTART